VRCLARRHTPDPVANISPGHREWRGEICVCRNPAGLNRVPGRHELPQLPLPAKIRTRFMPAVELDHDPARAEDDAYVDRKYHEVEDAIQEGMDALARKRALPLFA
jgi:hypothetical protein